MTQDIVHHHDVCSTRRLRERRKQLHFLAMYRQQQQIPQQQQQPLLDVADAADLAIVSGRFAPTSAAFRCFLYR